MACTVLNMFATGVGDLELAHIELYLSTLSCGYLHTRACLRTRCVEVINLYVGIRSCCQKKISIILGLVERRASSLTRRRRHQKPEIELAAFTGYAGLRNSF